MVALFAFSMAACKLDEDPGDDKVPKTLVINNVPSTDGSGANAVTIKGKQVTVAIFYVNSKQKTDIVALDQLTPVFVPDTATTTTVISHLVSGNEKKNGAPFTGTGLFYISLFIDSSDPNDFDDDTVYMYGSAQLPKQFSITDATTTIPWSEFAKQQ